MVAKPAQLATATFSPKRKELARQVAPENGRLAASLEFALHSFATDFEDRFCLPFRGRCNAKLVLSSGGECSLDALGCERNLADARAGGIKDRISEGSSDQGDG